MYSTSYMKNIYRKSVSKVFYVLNHVLCRVKFLINITVNAILLPLGGNVWFVDLEVACGINTQLIITGLFDLFYS